MPCYNPEAHERPIRLHERPIRLEAMTHHLTRLLCELCTTLDQKYPNYLPCLPEVNEWWLKHQEFDRIGDELAQRVEQHGIESLSQSERLHYWRRNDVEAS